MIGGGIAGLAAAWSLRDRDVVVLERDGRIGGRIMSVEADPYWLNLGAHLFPGPDTRLGAVAAELGIEVVPIVGSTVGIALRGAISTASSPIGHFGRLPLSPRERVQLAALGLRLQRGMWEYRRAATRAPGESAADVRTRLLRLHGDVSFADYLGRPYGVVADLVRVATHRASAEPEDISAGAGLSLFAHVWGGRRSIVGRNVVGGTERLPRAMAQAVGPDRIRTGARVTRVAQEEGHVCVDFDHRGASGRLRASTAVVATPAASTAEIVRPLRPELASALSAMTYGPFVCLGLVTRERSPSPWDGAYAIATPGRAFSVFFNHANVMRRGGARQPGGTLMVYAGGDLARRVFDWSDAAIRDVFVADLASMYPGVADVIEDAIVQRWIHGNAYARPGRWAYQPAIERSMAGGRVQLAGDYFVEDSSMDAAAQTGFDAADRIKRLLDEQEPGLPARFN